MKNLIKSLAAVILAGSMCACSAGQGESTAANDNSSTAENTSAEAASLLKNCAVAEAVYPESVSFENRYKVRTENMITYDISQKVTSFCYNSASEILKNSEGNALFSPTSLFYALSIATDGARGDTQEEMLEVLGFDTIKELSENAGILYRRIYTDDEYSKLKIANSLWVDNSTSLNKESGFFTDVSEDFYGSLYSVDFQNGKTGEMISRWISDNTNGQLAPSITTDPEQIMSIINTIHLKTEWINKFNTENNTDEVFHGTNGDKTTTFMNAGYDSHGFTRGDGWISSSLETKSNANVVFVLPDEGVDVRSLIDTPEKLEAMFGTSGESTCGEVTFKIPKLETKSDLSLNTAMKALGISSAFGDTADFTGITNDKAFISDIRQQSRLTMNEEGIEASSFTKIMYCGAALATEKAEIILNRPFIYGITYGDAGLLFVGIYENVE